MALIDKISEIMHVGIEATLSDTFSGPVPLEFPRDPENGDYASPISFVLAKKHDLDPTKVAEKIVSYLNQNLATFELKDLTKKEAWHKATDIIDRFESKGPFINIWLARSFLRSQMFRAIKEQDKFGRLPLNKKDSPTIVEYSSINVGKPMGIGHLRSTVIGDALANLLEATGRRVVRINYLGDWGTQFGKLIVAYQKWGDQVAFKKDSTTEMLRVYVKFNNELKKDPDLIKEARAAFKKLESSDKQMIARWRKFRKATLKDAKKIYDLLGIRFNEVTGESAYRHDLAKIEKLLLAKGLLKKSQGAKIVDLSKENLPPLIIEKQDASSIYGSRELAAAIDRYKKYKFSSMLYEVGLEQELHFKQIISVLTKLGYPWAKKIEHIGHGLYSLSGKRMSTRMGRTTGMLPLLEEATGRAQNIITEKNPELKDQAEVARAVGIGAVKYNDLSQSRLTNISFDFERMLSLEGNSAPYLQYAHARIVSVLRKSNLEARDLLALQRLRNKPIMFETKNEQALLRRLTRYPQVLLEAAHRRLPHLLANELFELAQMFNLFYAKEPILKASKQQKDSRLLLIAAVGVILKNGLKILGIKAPDQM